MDDYLRAMRREARITKKLLRLRTDQPFCIYCGMTDPRCLFRSGDSFDSMLRCRNCEAERHAVSSEALEHKLARFAVDGYPNPTCVVCGESDLRALERDHLAGEANSTFVEPLCLNCHAIKSDDAEDEPMASLRLRDPARSALALQAAFDIGLAAVLGLYGLAAGNEEGGAARAAFFALAALALVAWAIWNLSADEYLTQTLGPGYDKAINAEVPR